MPSLTYARRAMLDLDEIAQYTMQTWGPAQAVRYILSLRKTCELLLGKPLIGRLFDDSKPDWRRVEHQSHVVLYKVTRAGISVLRIVHHRRVLERALR